MSKKKKTLKVLYLYIIYDNVKFSFTTFPVKKVVVFKVYTCFQLLL